jgi:hypothetical protein
VAQEEMLTFGNGSVEKKSKEHAEDYKKQRADYF